jgi:hypothetical protein
VGGYKSEIRNCTIRDITRSASSFGEGEKKEHYCKITGNNIFNTCLHSGDGASIYTNGPTSISGDISYNWFSRCFVINGKSHLYFDHAGEETNTLIHHNVFFRNDPKTEAEKYKPLTEKGALRIYNNTFVLHENDFAWGKSFADTYAVDTHWISLGRETKNNLMVAGNEAELKFIDAAGGDYRLAQGSPAIDKGEIVPGITNGYAGSAPDIGAYEYNGEKWVPGPVDYTEPQWPFPVKDIIDPSVAASRLSRRAAFSPTFHQTAARLAISNIALPATIHIIDARGKVIRAREWKSAAPVSVSIRDIPSGMYIARVQSMDGSVVRRVVVRR